MKVTRTTSLGISVAEIFRAAGLCPSGPVRWGTLVPENRPGVYVIATVPRADANCRRRNMDHLQGDIAGRWLPRQPVIYIGRTKRFLSRRIREFYRHVYGNQRPHRGGQDVLLVQPRWVYWAPTESWAEAEDRMIERFKTDLNALPFANPMRAARVRATNGPTPTQP